MRIANLLCLIFGFVLALAMLAPTQAAMADDFDSNGVKIHYVVEGHGEPVILIHGLYSSAGINWQMPGTMKELAKHYEVVALDLRGHGASGKPLEDSKYGVQMVEDVARLMDHLHISKARIVGYSLGGMIAMKFVTMYPDRTTMAVLGGMGLFRAGSPLQQIWNGMGNGAEQSGKRQPVPPACLRGIAQLAITAEEAKAVTAPVSMIVGDKDPCRFLYVQPLHKLRHDWPVYVVHGAGHMTCIVMPDFKADLEKVLAESAPDTTGTN